jgi:hypothetical protein
MAETNGHAIIAADVDVAPAADTEVDALLAGLFEPTLFEIGPGRAIEIRPLVLRQADGLYEGGMKGAGLQRYLLARCCYVDGRPLGMAGADRLPVALANKLVPVVMAANGMATGQAGEDEGEAAVDPKA